MRFIDASRTLAAVAIILAAAPAAAVNCYMIVDRSNEVIYQDITSPIDLSDEGAAERDALRQRGQQLIGMEAEHCPAIDRGRAGKGGPATVKEIVAGMRPAASFGTTATPASSASDSTVGIALPRITVPRDTGGGMSPGGPPSGMSIR